MRMSQKRRRLSLTERTSLLSSSMWKRIISQNRGKGTPTYRAPSHRYKAALKLIKADKNETVKARVVEVLHDPARSAPIGRVQLADGTERLVLIPESLCVGDEIASLS